MPAIVETVGVRVDVDGEMSLRHFASMNQTHFNGAVRRQLRALQRCTSMDYG